MGGFVFWKRRSIKGINLPFKWLDASVGQYQGELPKASELNFKFKCKTLASNPNESVAYCIFFFFLQMSLGRFGKLSMLHSSEFESRTINKFPTQAPG